MQSGLSLPAAELYNTPANGSNKVAIFNNLYIHMYMCQGTDVRAQGMVYMPVYSMYSVHVQVRMAGCDIMQHFQTVWNNWRPLECLPMH